MPILDSPDFDRAFVPIDSLTSSPRSSTESTSVLEWNSNSGSEGFSVRSLDHQQYFHTSPPTPCIPSISPRPREHPFPGRDEAFTIFASAEPIVDSVSDTLASGTFTDEYRDLLGALGEKLSLMSSVTQWQNQPGFDRPETPSGRVIEDIPHTIHDKQSNNIATSPNRSVATSSISAVTATPSLHVSSLFLPPAPPKPYVYPAPTSAVSNHTESKSISIAQYFQIKAAKSEEAEPQPPVDGPARPISTASYLSYTSSAASLKAASPVQTPVALPLPDHDREAPSLHETWHELIPKVGKRPSSTRVNPPSPRGLPTFWNCILDSHSSSRQPQMENNNTASPFNPFTTQITPPPSQGTDTLAGNLKSQAPSKATRPIPPAMPSQLEVVTPSVKPIKPIVPNLPWLASIPDRQSPYVESPYDSFYGKTHKSTNPVGFSLSAPSSAYPCSMPGRPRPIPWCMPRTRDIGQASPESTDSWLPPAPALPSTSSVSARWPSPTPSESQISASARPPSPVTLQPESNGPSSNMPYLPLMGDIRPRALPIPNLPKLSGTYSQAPYTPRYTGSTLPRDMPLRAGPPAWGPTPRRLRFAPLPPTPSAGLPFPTIPSSTLPYTTPLPPYPLHPMPYPYPPPAPQIPAPVSTPYSSWRNGPQNSSPLWAPHPVFWYSDGSIVFIVCRSLFLVHLKKMLMIPFW